MFHYTPVLVLALVLVLLETDTIGYWVKGCQKWPGHCRLQIIRTFKVFKQMLDIARETDQL